MKVKVSVAQACLTLCDPMDRNLPGSSVHGIIQGRILEQVAISSSGGFVRSTWPVRRGASRGDWMRRLNSAPLPGAPDEGEGGTDCRGSP